MVTEATETPVEDCAALLTDSGYNVEDSAGRSREVENDRWYIAFHSSLENTITVSVVEN